jgi:formylmethanofuran dehydrogenase subunit E-like metal-binding protein
MEDLSVKKHDQRLLVLTNAIYVKLQGKDCLNYVKILEEKTGCSVGNTNMLFFQRPQNHPLRIVLFRKDTGDTVAISCDNKKCVSEKFNMSVAAASGKDFWKNSKSLIIGSDIFSIATIAGSWALGAPYDFLKCAELHNHICPGLTSGYFIAKTIIKNYPLKKGESYTFVSCPVWCKEDAIQVILDATPGKQKMVVKNLTDSQKKNLTVKNPAGILLIWNKKEEKGRGIIFSMDFDKARKLVVEGSPKAAIVFAMIPLLNKPEEFVTAVAEFDITPKIYEGMLAAGTNPYEIAGSIKK